MMFKKDNIVVLGFAFLVILVVVVGVWASVFLYNHFKKDFPNNFGQVQVSGEFDFKNFESEKEFKEYLSFVESMGNLGYGRMGQDSFIEESAVSMDAPGSKSTGVDRYSSTNVQVQGIDEKDIVKTDGENIYFSGESWDWYRALPEGAEMDMVIEPDFFGYQNELEIIRAFPPKDMEKLSTIDVNGEMLLFEKNLVIFDYDGIYTYDVSNANSPKEAWDIQYDERFSLVDARLLGDEIFVVLNNYQPNCPVAPIFIEGVERNIACSDIYYSPSSTESDSMYVIYKINANTGQVKDTISFLGSAMNTVVYMSFDNIFVTYYLDGDLFEIQYRFVSENKNLFDDKVVEDIQKLRDYEISLDAKMVEFEKIIDNFTRTMDSDDLLLFENEMSNKMEDFYKKYIRELNYTGILRIDNNSLKVEATGKVPGFVLNQFAVDEYEGFLRIATTVGQGLWGSSAKSLNDLYVLDEDMKIVGNVLDMGEGERIYSSRFIGDKGYIVTFKEIDPFYVLDLSNPEKPEIKGELKIPGYSSYLHPLAENIILGVGQEDSNVKLSLFDVSNVQKPQEKDKYILKEYWSDVLNTHKAFMIDSKHEIFFIPGGEGGYVFSYKNDKLELIKSVSGYSVRRALFINDYLYIITDERIIVLDQNTWERVNDFKFSNR